MELSPNNSTLFSNVKLILTHGPGVKQDNKELRTFLIFYFCNCDFPYIEEMNSLCVYGVIKYGLMRVLRAVTLQSNVATVLF